MGKRFPTDADQHGADPRRFDPTEGKSWCACGDWHYPHPIVKHNLNEGYRHLECQNGEGATKSDFYGTGAFCTNEIGHRGDHSCVIGNDAEGWATRTWPNTWPFPKQ